MPSCPPIAQSWWTGAAPATSASCRRAPVSQRDCPALLLTIPSLKPLHPADKQRTLAYVRCAKPSKQGSTPISIQLKPPESMRWNHRNFPHQIMLCMFPDFQCAAPTHLPPDRRRAASQRRAASHSIVPEHRLRIAPLGRKGFPRTTPDAVELVDREMGRSPFTSLPSRYTTVT